MGSGLLIGGCSGRLKIRADFYFTPEGKIIDKHEKIKSRREALAAEPTTPGVSFFQKPVTKFTSKDNSTHDIKEL